VKALSLTQPWAHLVMLGAKQWETRSWKAFHRGEIAIHASKNYPNWARNYEINRHFKEALVRASSRPNDVIGKIIAIATLTDCRPTTDFWIEEMYPASDRAVVISDAEAAFGNFEAGRYAFKLENVRPVKPIECKGALGLWTVPPEIEHAIRQEVAA
jgi:hypothetical protein